MEIVLAKIFVFWRASSSYTKWVYKIVFLSFVYKRKRKSLNIIVVVVVVVTVVAVVVVAFAVVAFATKDKIAMQLCFAVGGAVTVVVVFQLNYLLIKKRYKLIKLSKSGVI